jgi:hypothetical protein
MIDRFGYYQGGPIFLFIIILFMAEGKEPQSKMTMAILAFVLGYLGIHRYMMGYSNWWLMIVTFGGFGFWSLYDFIMILTDKMPMADGTPLT